MSLRRGIAIHPQSCPESAENGMFVLRIGFVLSGTTKQCPLPQKICWRVCTPDDEQMSPQTN